MSPVKYTIPGFLGGISQQPPEFRRTDQCEDLKNIAVEPGFGAKKRFGSEIVGLLDGIQAKNKYRVHLFESGGINYILVSGGPAVRIYNAETGVRSTLTQSSDGFGNGALGYLEGANSDNIKAVTVGDSVMVINKSKIPVLETKTAPIEAEVSEAVGVRTYPFFRSVDKVNDLNQQGITSLYPDWNDGILYPVGSRVTFDSRDWISKTHVFNESNINQVPFSGSNFWTLLSVNESTSTFTNEVADWDPTKAYSENSAVYRYNGLWRSRVAIGGPSEGTLNEFDPTKWNLDIGVGNEPNDFDYEQTHVDSTVLTSPIVTDLGADAPFDLFSIFKHDLTSSGGGVTYYRLNNLEPIALPASDPKKLVWIPHFDKGVNLVSLDKTTMPIIFKATGATSFNAEFPDWKSLWTTDATNNSGDRDISDLPDEILPGFLNKKIVSAGLIQKRLAFAAEENISLSKTDGLFSFWQQNIDIADDDPIEFSMPSTGQSEIGEIVAFEDSMLIFGTERQYELRSLSGAITPTSVSLSPTTGYSVKTSVPPLAIRDRVLFLSEGEVASSVYEYFYSRERNGKVAFDINDSTPSLIPKDAYFFSGTAVSNQYLVSSGDSNRLFMYDYLWRDNQKVFSAWHNWFFDYALAIRSSYYIQDTLYLITQDNSGLMFLEKVPRNARSVNIGGKATDIYLDRFSSNISSGSYSVGNDETTFTMPFAWDSTPDIIFDDGFVQTASSVNGTSAVFSGDLSGKTPVGIGFMYESSIEISKQFFRTGQTGSPDVSARLQLRRMTFNLTSIGVLNVFVNGSARKIKAAKIGAVNTNQVFGPETKFAEIPIRADGRKSVISVGDVGLDSYQGFTINGISVEAVAHPRGR